MEVEFDFEVEPELSPGQDIEKLFNGYNSECEKFKEFINVCLQEKRFCDLTLKTTDGKTFQVHKNILYSASGYFKGFFHSEWVDTKNAVIELDDNVDSEGLELALEYIYNGRVSQEKLDFNKAIKLYKTASFLCMDILKELVEKHLINTLGPEGCLNLWRTAGEHLNDNLRGAAIKFIESNYVSFVERHLNELTASEMKNILSYQYLRCSQNEKLFSILKWVKVNYDFRQDYIKDFIQHVNFDSISNVYIQRNIEQDVILSQNIFLKEFIEKEKQRRIETQNDMAF